MGKAAGANRRPVTASGRRVMVIAHRGYHQREPENTLAAYSEALKLGADGIEVDVRLTGDGTLVCFHDWYLRRLTGFSGRVTRTGVGRLLDLPIRHATSRVERPVATLSEVLALVEDRAQIVLDLKKEGVRPTRLEPETIRELREFGLRDNVTISSFNPWVLKRCKQLAPEYTTALIASSRLGVRLFNREYCDSLHVHYQLLRRRWFWRPVPACRRLMVWTVDRRADLDWPLPDLVAAVITNRPERWSLRSGHRPRSVARPGERRA